MCNIIIHMPSVAHTYKQLMTTKLHTYARPPALLKNIFKTTKMYQIHMNNNLAKQAAFI